MSSPAALSDPAQDDPLDGAPLPERLYYQTGVLLDREDFRAEQTYHRGRLARLARWLHGYGTVAGLEAVFEPALAPTPLDPGHEARLNLAPGLAIDRLGRLVEVWDHACVRLDPWLAWYNGEAGRRARLAGATWAAAGTHPAGVMADLFLSFRPCPHGRTPAFDTGAYDALDATVPSRIRDAWRVELIPRDERDAGDPAREPPLPAPRLPDPAPLGDAAARLLALRTWKLHDAWDEPARLAEDGSGMTLEPEHVRGLQSGDELFLARVVIPVTTRTGPDPDPAAPPGATATLIERDPAQATWVDNLARRFAYSAPELAWFAADLR
jgi:hypothetical protein